MQSEANVSWLVTILKPIAEHPLLQITGFALTIIALVLAFVFYRRSIREKKPRYAVFSQTLIEDLPASLPSLRITYDDIPQERVTLATIFFWNDGREAIRREDIADTDRLRITIEDAELLSAIVEDETNKACNILIARSLSSPNTAELSFAFLDHNDGFRIGVVHNGREKSGVKVEGTIIGGKIERLTLNLENRPAPRTLHLFLELAALFCVISLLTVLVESWIPNWRLPDVDSAMRTIDIFVISFAAVAGVLFWLGGKFFYKITPRVPQRLWMFW